MQQSAVKLSEIGPRMTLELFKVEKDVCEGDILYHKFVTKSEEAARQTKQRLENAAALKSQRRATQEENVKRKRCMSCRIGTTWCGDESVVRNSDGVEVRRVHINEAAVLL